MVKKAEYWTDHGMVRVVQIIEFVSLLYRILKLTYQYQGLVLLLYRIQKLTWQSFQTDQVRCVCCKMTYETHLKEPFKLDTK